MNNNKASNSLWNIGVKTQADDAGEPVFEVVAKEVKPTFLNKLRGAKDLNAEVPAADTSSSFADEKSNKVGSTVKASASSAAVKPKSSSKSTSTNSSRPSVYQESLEMLTAALLIYTFADLREMARDNDDNNDNKSSSLLSEDQLQTPISMDAIMKVIKMHRVELEKKASDGDIDHGELAARLKALKDLQKQQSKSSSTSSMVGRMLRGSSKTAPAELTHFHDETSTKGMCYGIAVNHVRRRITVVFRGSVTFQDFITDAKKSHTKTKNTVVVATGADTPKNIRVHTGFHEYLFMEDTSNTVRLNHIMADVKGLLTKYPGYSIYSTGHSLGGALATLFGFYAAQDDDIVGEQQPVVVVSVASPRVGDNDFRAAFQTLEGMGRLQHLRMSNKEDMATLLPFVALKDDSWSSLLKVNPIDGNVNLYKHCGIHLKFNTSSPSAIPPAGKDNTDVNLDDNRKELFSMTYAKNCEDKERAYPEELKKAALAAKSVLGSLVSTVTSTTNFAKLTKNHGCDEYEARLVLCRRFLSQMTLDQLYQNESLVGASVKQSVKQ